MSLSYDASLRRQFMLYAGPSGQDQKQLTNKVVMEVPQFLDTFTVRKSA